MQQGCWVLGRAEQPQWCLGASPTGALQLAGEGTNPHAQILLQVAMRRGATSSMGQIGAPQLPACIFLKTLDFCPIYWGGGKGTSSPGSVCQQGIR